MKRIFLGLIICNVLISCATKRKNTNVLGTESVRSAGLSNVNSMDKDLKFSLGDIKNQVQKNAYDYQTLSIKSEAAVSLPGINQELNVNMRMEKGAKIWISATALFGIEVGRVMITPERIQILNKIQGKYIEKPFSFVKSYVGDLNFQTLQDIFVGNVPDDFWRAKGTVAETDAQKILLNCMIDSFVLQYQTNDTFRPQIFEGKDGKGLHTCRVSYANFTAEKLPTQILMNAVSEQKQFGLQLNYTSVQRNIPLEFPFNVPSKYETIN